MDDSLKDPSPPSNRNWAHASQSRTILWQTTIQSRRTALIGGQYPISEQRVTNPTFMLVTHMKNSATKYLAGIAVIFGSVAVYADTINFSGQLDVVLEDTGSAVYSGVPVGTYFFGSIDDVSISGSITDGTTRTEFDCCIAAGGLSVENDEALDAESATLLNSLLGTSFEEGDLIDLIDIEGDAVTLGGGRIEIGLSYVLDPGAFDDGSLDNYPPNPDDVLIAFFFIAEEDNQEMDNYSALGVLDPAADFGVISVILKLILDNDP